MDSAVAMAILKEKGYDVSAITMVLHSHSSCELADAKRAAASLSVPHYTLDLCQAFSDIVIRYFTQSYQRGETPNPCVLCNKEIKLGLLLNEAIRLGADKLATGHYARIEEQDGRFLLKKAKNIQKDQSYVLYALSQEQLSRLLFPLGELSKEDVREYAKKKGLAVAEKSDSQDICFIPDGDYAEFIEARSGKSPPGDFVDLQGNVLGQHKGLIYYTCGQRKGIGGGFDRRYYVKQKNFTDNTITLCEQSELYSRICTAKSANFISIPQLTEKRMVMAKPRYNAPEAVAEIEPLPDGKVRVCFEVPQRALTMGQSVVFYDGEYVVGGAVIDSVDY